ncbi:aldehyde dehydrogenase family protein [Haloferax sp. DFSO52]|uniref:aldehyde dehydrogenase family protein n=1 Tax=Haloferax sp. DFSO52 TaxID=3388505 RepID=UPI003A840E0E
MRTLELSEEFDREWRMLVDGSLVPASDGGTLSVRNPATGGVFTDAPDGTAEDVDTAVAGANRAADSLAEMTPRERGDLLHGLVDVLEAHATELAELEVVENGKPISQARGDVNSAIERVRYYAGGADKFLGDAVLDSSKEIQRKIFEPLGVVGIIIPWNWPLVNSIDFAAIAIATGNAAVIKAAPETPLSALRAGELFAEHLPDGSFNVISGRDEAGVALVEHPDVDKIAFVGNDKTGEIILRSLADSLTPAMMELGGKNAAVVFPDADLDRAVDGVVCSSFKNNGEACSGSERLLVHEDIYDDFIPQVSAKVEAISVGEGTDEDTQVGPLISERHRDMVASKIDAALEDGATLLAQAELPDEDSLEGGYWFPPTLLGNVDADSDIMQEEVFGPVLGVMPFGDESEALELINDTEYGLSTYIWTSNLQRAHRLAVEVEVGKVSINNPSGGRLGVPHGGQKRTGFGRKNDFAETMREFTQAKGILIDLTDSDLSL